MSERFYLIFTLACIVLMRMRQSVNFMDLCLECGRIGKHKPDCPLGR